jgi:hypothetical protein
VVRAPLPLPADSLGRRSLIFFADQPDFQQNNVAEIGSEGTGGVTEGFRSRVVMPFTGVYQDNHHVLGTSWCTCSSTTSPRRRAACSG